MVARLTGITYCEFLRDAERHDVTRSTSKRTVQRLLLCKSSRRAFIHAYVLAENNDLEIYEKGSPRSKTRSHDDTYVKNSLTQRID